MSAAEDALKGLKFADLAKTVFGSGPDAGAVNTPSGSLTTSAPEILRSVQFPDFPASAVTDLPGVGIASGEAVVPEGATTSLLDSAGGMSELTSSLAESLGITAAEASSVLGAAGAIPGIIMTALSNEPNLYKAVDAATTVAGAAAAPYTAGLSSLAAAVLPLLRNVGLYGDPKTMSEGGIVANEILGPGIPTLLDKLGVDLPGAGNLGAEIGWALLFGLPGIGSLFGHTGPYMPTREAALREAQSGLGELGGAYQQAAQSGDPAQELQALQTTESGGHIYSGLNLPPDIARQLSLDVPRGAETVPVDWHSLSPQQFEQFVGLVGQQDPSVLGQWVTGSGDVPYLPQGPAQAAANQAAQDARAMLTYLAGQQQQSATEMTQAPQAPAAMSPGGGATELEEITA